MAAYVLVQLHQAGTLRMRAERPLISYSVVLQSAIAGYSSQGNLFAGTGYWALQTDMPTQLTDHIVSSDPSSSPVILKHRQCNPRPFALLSAGKVDSAVVVLIQFAWEHIRVPVVTYW